MKKDKEIVKRLSKWYKKRSSLEKTIIFSTIGLIIFAFIMSFVIEAYFGYVQGKVVDSQQCIDIGVSTALALQENSSWQNIFIDYKPIITLLLFLIGLSWLVHGVQIRLFA